MVACHRENGAFLFMVMRHTQKKTCATALPISRTKFVDDEFFVIAASSRRKKFP